MQYFAAAKLTNQLFQKHILAQNTKSESISRLVVFLLRLIYCLFGFCMYYIILCMLLLVIWF